MGFLDKAKDLVAKNVDKVDTVINKAGDIVDQKTDGKYTETVDKVQDAARKIVQDNTNTDATNTDAQVPPDQQSGQAPPPQAPPTS
ncbi:hypothetical protein NGTWS0302_16400 [Mycolicibacterium cyprinidarum]|uniref:Kanamycin biosynthetic protein n=1 Tax=Mycolicibacterium cyprinidarum TaxID=2860311 RepID=A0ABQ4VE44_9MYCO|nr:hypothetical protein NGTWS1702_22020 [Mycolicibacterium sp. NGTWSNA01]GJF18347.1 hypothetical protein NGTWS0302_16400 [Mycolicibacterium sp. NGTWS0302]